MLLGKNGVLLKNLKI